jgi:exopolyphosphatase/pppGpp-phosphohydrolase
MQHSYKVRLDNGRIEYIADYACKECRYASNDKDFFTEIEGELYCSLHKKRKGK